MHKHETLEESNVKEQEHIYCLAIFLLDQPKHIYCLTENVWTSFYYMCKLARFTLCHFLQYLIQCASGSNSNKRN